MLIGGSGASFASFSFWTVIVGINTIVTIKEKGNYVFPLSLTLGNFATSVALLITGQFVWGYVEWLTSILVIVSIGFWIFGKRSTIILVSTIAISIAGIPQLFLAWTNPSSISLLIWSGFLIASILGVLAGKNWSIKERLYPTARLVLYALVILFAIKRFF